MSNKYISIYFNFYPKNEYWVTYAKQCSWNEKCLYSLVYISPYQEKD